jgi:hypothetical protein
VKVQLIREKRLAIRRDIEEPENGDNGSDPPSAANALSQETASKILALLAEAASAAPEGDGPGPG